MRGCFCGILLVPWSCSLYQPNGEHNRIILYQPSEVAMGSMNHIMPRSFQHDQAGTSPTFSSMSYTRQSQALGLAIALLLSFGLAVAMQAQSPRNYIYLFDCTTSMNKGDQPIWKPAQEALRQTIERLAQQPNTTFSIVPFNPKMSLVVQARGH